MAALQVLAVVVAHAVQLVHLSGTCSRLARALAPLPRRPGAEQPERAGAGRGVGADRPLRQVLPHVQPLQRELYQRRQLGRAPLAVGLPEEKAG